MKCKDCGFTFMKEHEPSRREHRKFHNEVLNGIPMAPLKKENTIWENANDRVFLVTSHSSKPERIRARKIGRLANIECHYDGGIYSEHENPDNRDIHMFIICRNNIAIGLIILEQRSSVCSYTWEEVEQHVNKELEEKDPIWSIGFIWVHNKHRRSGVARMLVSKSINYLNVELKSVGIYTPLSNSGKSFMQSIFPNNFIVAK